jgi:hypothetical protein
MKSKKYQYIKVSTNAKLVPLLVGAIQELKAEIETLKSQIEWLITNGLSRT